MSEHIPVLLHEAIDGLNIKKDGIYVDLTLGRCGHFKEILHRLTEGLAIGVDQDEEALLAAKEILKDEENYRLVRSNFVHLDEILKEEGIDKVDGIIADLGVSSPQFDEGERGFSYKVDAPLDMRMDLRSSLSARDIVNTYSLNDLTRVFREYGDEKYSYQIAKAILREREKKPIETTLELVEIVKRCKPDKELKKIGHPAKQVFQALRIEVNDELKVLKEVIPQCLKHLKIGGRLAIITFHSGEDRIVKEMFKEETVIIGNRINGPTIEEKKNFVLVNRHPIAPSEKEMDENHRSKSAKLRIIERIS